MFETLIPADISDICNARLAAKRIEGLVNVALREQVFNFGSAMKQPPIGGEPKVSLAIGPAVPKVDGYVRVTASATFIYYPFS